MFGWNRSRMPMPSVTMDVAPPPMASAAPYVPPSAGKPVSDRLQPAPTALDKFLGDTLEDLPPELSGGVQTASEPSGLQDLPGELFDLPDAAMQGLKRMSPNVFGTARMTPQYVPEGHMPTSGLTVAPKGGVTREGSADDVALQNLIEGTGLVRERSPATHVTGGEAFSRGLGDIGIDLVTSLPAVPWETINLPVSGMAMGAEALGYPEIAQGLREGQENPGVLWPLKKLADVSQGVEPEQVRALPGLLSGQSYDDALEEQVRRTEDVVGQQPNRYAAGRLVGAPLALLGTKGAGAKRLQDLERRIDRSVDASEAHAAAFKAGENVPRIRFGQGPAAKKAQRAFVHAAENASDAMLMSMANDADPATGAGIGAAASLGSSGANKLLDFLNPLSGVKGISPMGKFMGEMGGAFAGMYALQNLTPGQDENVFEAVEGATEKALAATALSLLTRGQGARGTRVGAAGGVAPHLTEVFAGIPRQFFNSFVSLQLGEPRQAAMEGMRATFEGAETIPEERRNELMSMMRDNPDKAIEELIKIGRGLKGQM